MSWLTPVSTICLLAGSPLARKREVSYCAIVQIVQVFGRRQYEALGTLSCQASKKRQGTKSREVGPRLGSGYGDLMSAPTLMVGATLPGSDRMCGQARWGACNGHLGKRSERISGRAAH